MTEESSVSANLRKILTPWFTGGDSTEKYIDRWPSCYPPNLHSRAETINGKLSRRDYLPKKPFTPEHYVQFQSCNARIKQVIFEDTKNGDRDTEGPNILHVTMRNTASSYLSFASCNSCYRLKARNFSDTDKTPHPMNSQMSCPDLPQIGLCGCILCNKCVRSVVYHPENSKMNYVHCPYCGNHSCFSKYFRIWAVTENVWEENGGSLDSNVHFYY